MIKSISILSHRHVTWQPKDEGWFLENEDPGRFLGCATALETMAIASCQLGKDRNDDEDDWPCKTITYKIYAAVTNISTNGTLVA